MDDYTPATDGEDIWDAFAPSSKTATPPSPKRTYTQSEIEDSLRRAGWDEKHVPTMGAIAMSEGLRTPDNKSVRMDSFNPGVGPGGVPTKEKSAGPFQVNLLAHPQYDKRKLLTDIDYGAKAALDIFKDRQSKGRDGFSAWGAYTNGSYKPFTKTSGGPRTKQQPTTDIWDAFAPSPTDPTQAPARATAAPVTESDVTLDSQRQAAHDPASIRAAVLYTGPESVGPRAANETDIETPGGLLRANTAKLQQYLQQTGYAIEDLESGAADFTELIGGKADPTGEQNGTTGQTAVMTTDEHGNELVSSSVSHAAQIPVQAALDAKQFPGKKIQTQVVPAEAVVQHRLNAQGKKALADANAYQRSIGEAELTPEQFMAAQKENPDPTVTVDQFKPQDFTVSGGEDAGKSLAEFEPAQGTPDGGSISFKREVGRSTDSTSGTVATYQSTAKMSEEDAARNAFLNAGAKYGATPENFERFKQAMAAKGKPIFDHGYQPGSAIDVTWQALKDGGIDVQTEQRMEQAQNPVASEVDTRGPGRYTHYKAVRLPDGRIDYQPQIDDTQDTLPSAGDEVERAAADLGGPIGQYNYQKDKLKPARTQMTPEEETANKDYAKQVNDEIQNMETYSGGNPLNGLVARALVGIGSGLSTGLGKLAAGAEKFMPPLMLNAAVQNYLTGRTPGDSIGHASNRIERVNELSTPKEGVYRWAQKGGTLAGSFAPYVVVGLATGGNPILTFGLTDMLTGAGGSGKYSEGLKGLATGTATGAGFSAFNTLGRMAVNGLFGEKVLSIAPDMAGMAEKGATDFSRFVTPPDKATGPTLARDLNRAQAMIGMMQRAVTPEEVAEAAKASARLEEILSRHGITAEEVASGKLAERAGARFKEMSTAQLTAASNDISRWTGEQIARRLVRGGTEIGLATASGFMVAKAEGANNEDAVNSALMMGAMQTLAHILHKDKPELTDAEMNRVSGQVIRVPDEKGTSHDLMVLKDGDGLRITDITGPVSPSLVSSVMLPKPSQLTAGSPDTSTPSGTSLNGSTWVEQNKPKDDITITTYDVTRSDGRKASVSSGKKVTVDDFRNEFKLTPAAAEQFQEFIDDHGPIKQVSIREFRTDNQTGKGGVTYGLTFQDGSMLSDLTSVFESRKPPKSETQSDLSGTGETQTHKSSDIVDTEGNGYKVVTDLGEGKALIVQDAKGVQKRLPERKIDPMSLASYRTPLKSVPAEELPDHANLENSLDIPRSEMPQITAEQAPAFEKHAEEQGATVTLETAKVSDLLPTQNEYNPKNAAGIPEGKLKKPLLVSSDNRVLDGHNTMMALQARDPNATVQIRRINKPAKEALEIMRSFPGVTFKSVEDVGVGAAPSLKRSSPGYVLNRSEIDPGGLPDERWKIFNKELFDADPARHEIVPLDALVSDRNLDKDPQYLEHGERKHPLVRAYNHMVNAVTLPGLERKRAPIEVTENKDGTFTVQDGHVTLALARKLGWKDVPVEVMNRAKTPRPFTLPAPTTVKGREVVQRPHDLPQEIEWEGEKHGIGWIALPPRLAAIQARTLGAVLANPRKWLDKAYALPGGRHTIDADMYRELFPEYRGVNGKDAQANVQGVHEAVSLIAKMAGAERINDLQRKVQALAIDHKPVVLLLAGGPASGKGSAAHTEAKAADLVLDRVTSNAAKAIAALQSIKDKGLVPHFALVVRDFGEQAIANVDRSTQIGRLTPSDVAAEGTFGASDAVLDKGLWNWLEANTNPKERMIFYVYPGKKVGDLPSRISIEDLRKLWYNKDGKGSLTIDELRTFWRDRSLAYYEQHRYDLDEKGQLKYDPRTALAIQGLDVPEWGSPDYLRLERENLPDGQVGSGAGRRGTVGLHGDSAGVPGVERPASGRTQQPDRPGNQRGTGQRVAATQAEIEAKIGAGKQSVNHAPPPKGKPIVLVFGGAFNPMHTGHLGAAEDAKAFLEAQGYEVEKIVITPTPPKLLEQKFDEDKATNAAPLELRAAIARATVGDRSDVEVATGPAIEAEASTIKPKRTQTADWVASDNPGRTVVNITGEDATVEGAPNTFPALYDGATGTSHEGYYYLTMPRDEAEGMSSSKVRAQLKESGTAPEGSMTPEAERLYKQHLEKVPLKKAAEALKLSDTDTKWLTDRGFGTYQGRITGAPPSIKTKQDVLDQIEKAANDAIADGHAEDKVWYQEAGKAIREYSHGDRKLMEQMTRIVAVLSQSAGVPSNAVWTVKAAYQIARGEEPATGRFPNVFREQMPAMLAAQNFTRDLRGIDRKLEAFYQSLHDAAFEESKYPKAVVVDRHAINYIWNDPKKDVVSSDTQYDYAEALIRQAADVYRQKTGERIKPGQMQSMLWGIWKREGAATTTEETAGGGAWNYPQFFERATAYATGEAIPSLTTPEGRAIMRLPYEDREQFTREAVAVYHDKDGQNLILKHHGISLYKEGPGSGGYEGNRNPNVITGVLLPTRPAEQVKAGGGPKYDDDALMAVANDLMYLHTQDSVPSFRADVTMDPAALDKTRAMRAKKAAQGVPVKAVPDAALGFFFEFDKPVTSQQEAEFFKQLQLHLGPDAGYTKMGDGRRISVINFRDSETQEPFGLSDPDFRDAVGRVKDAVSPKEVIHYGAETKYPYHDWAANPEDGVLLQSATDRSGPDWATQLRDWRSEEQAIAAKWAAKAPAAEGEAPLKSVALSPEELETQKKTELLQHAREAFAVPLINDPKLLGRPVRLPIVTASGRKAKAMRTATVSELQKPLEEKAKVLEKLLDCLHG